MKLKHYFNNINHQKIIHSFVCYISIVAMIYGLVIITINIFCFGYNHSNIIKQKALKPIKAITGLNINIEKIYFNWHQFYRLNLTANKLTISNFNLNIEYAYFSLSYWSLIKIQPVFDKIQISNSLINLNIDKNQNIYFNNTKINISNNKTNQRKIDKFILNQKQIKINNINFSYQNENSSIRFSQHHLNLELNNDGLYHQFWLKMFNENNSNFSNISFNWLSTKNIYSLTDPAMFKRDLNFKIINKLSYQNYQHKQKNIDFDLHLIVKNGYLYKFNGNFNIDKQIIYHLLTPSLKGKIYIEQNKGDIFDYHIQSNNLQLNDQVIDIKNYLNITNNHDKHIIQFHNINLNQMEDKFKSLCTFLHIRAYGQISQLKYSWQGAIFYPKQYNAIIDAHNITITNGQKFFIKNATAVIEVENNHSVIHVQSHNLALRVNNIFQQDLIFKKLEGNIKINKLDHGLDIQSENLQLITNDFMATTNIFYSMQTSSNRHNLNFLKITAHIPDVNINKVDNYLPNSGIPSSVHKYLKMSLLDGHAHNTDLEIAGDLSNFPFKENSNEKFLITTEILNGKMRYLNQWPPLEYINGKFTLKNRSITINAENAYCLQAIKLDKAQVTIPDYTANNPVLNASGKIFSNAEYILKYLSETKILSSNLNQYLQFFGHIDSLLTLKVPLSTPEKTDVIVLAKLLNNKIKTYQSPAIEVNSINGIINVHNQHLSAHNIAGKIGNSSLKINIYPVHNKMTININAHSFNYSDFINQYYPSLKNIISGQANTNVDINLSSQTVDNIILNSDLLGLNINLPYPLYKNQSNITPLKAVVSFKNLPEIKTMVVSDNLQLAAIIEQNQVKNMNVKIGHNTADISIPNNYHYTFLLNSDYLDLNQWQKSLYPYYNKNNQSQLNSIYVATNINNLILNGNNLGHTQSRWYINNNLIQSKVNNQHFMLSAHYQNKICKINIKQIDIEQLSKLLNSSKNDIKSNDHGWHLTSTLPNIDLHIEQLKFKKITASLDSKFTSHNHSIQALGSLANKDINLNFTANFYCIYCPLDTNSKNSIYINADIKNFGNITEQITNKNIIAKGNGKITGNIYWDKLFLDNIKAKITGKLHNGFLLKTQGLIERVLSLFSLQGIKDIHNANLFNSDLAFQSMSFDFDLNNSIIKGNKILIVNDFINIFSTINIINNFNNIEGYLIATPQLGNNIALISAGIAVGFAVIPILPVVLPVIGVIGGQSYFNANGSNDHIRDMFTNTYCISGSMSDISFASCSLQQK